MVIHFMADLAPGYVVMSPSSMRNHIIELHDYLKLKLALTAGLIDRCKTITSSRCTGWIQSLSYNAASYWTIITLNLVKDFGLERKLIASVTDNGTPEIKAALTLGKALNEPEELILDSLPSEYYHYQCWAHTIQLGINEAIIGMKELKNHGICLRGSSQEVAWRKAW